ncbi:MAG: hypothetical protein H5U20_09995 [Rhodobacteraceae bacterium]|nr:hypothetical protein [Paracoccaceae bacterium]
MSPRAAHPDAPPLAVRIAFPGPAAAAWPFAAALPAIEIAAALNAASVALGWSWALGPWRVRVSVERDLEGDA